MKWDDDKNKMLKLKLLDSIVWYLNCDNELCKKITIKMIYDSIDEMIEKLLKSEKNENG